VEEKERAILAAAREVFVEQGVEGARMAEIARRAGVAEGTVYLYYKAKHHLMEAVVAEFWTALTEDARSAVDPTADTFDQIRAYASYHLTTIMDNLDFIDLTAVLRTSSQESMGSRDLVRSYIQVFDQILRRGMDRGNLDGDVPAWIIRDLFSGSIEHSARTMMLRGQRDPQPVVDNLVRVLRAAYGRPSRWRPDDPEKLPSLVRRLESAVERLEQVEPG